MASADLTHPDVIRDRIARLDDLIRAVRAGRATQRARAAAESIRPGVRGVVYEAPEGVESELAGFDTEFANLYLHTLIEELNNRDRYVSHAVLLADGSVVEDRAVGLAVLDAFEGSVDVPLGLVDDVAPAIGLEKTLRLLGWPPLATLSKDEIAHDSDAYADDASGQTYRFVREGVVRSLIAFIRLDEEDAVPAADLSTLVDERDRLIAAQATLNTALLAEQVHESYPDAAVAVVARDWLEPQIQAIELISDGGDVLYKLQNGNDTLDDAIHFDVEPVALVGEKVSFPSLTLFSALSGEPFETGTRVNVLEAISVGNTSDVTVADLVEAGLLVATHWPPSHHVWWNRVNDHLAGGPARWREEDVTAFMGAASGAFQTAMVQAFCAAAGIACDETDRLITGRHLVHHSNGKPLGSREIDLVVARWDDESQWIPRVGIEAKFDAKVNGNWDCTNPAHGRAYTNQIICYPAGCAHSQLAHERGGQITGVKFVWLWDRVGDSLVGVNNIGVTPRDESKHPAIYRSAWAVQEEAKSIWYTATWARLREAIREELRGAGCDERLITAVVRGTTRRSVARS